MEKMIKWIKSNKAPFLYAAILAAFVLYLICFFVAKPATDITVTVVAPSLTAAQSVALQEAFSALEIDLSGDGIQTTRITGVNFPDDYDALSFSQQTEINSRIASDNYALLLCTEKAYQYLSLSGRICLWSEYLPNNTAAQQMPVGVPLAAIPELSAVCSLFEQPMYLCLRFPSEAYQYVKQSEAVEKFLLPHALYQ